MTDTNLVFESDDNIPTPVTACATPGAGQLFIPVWAVTIGHLQLNGLGGSSQSTSSHATLDYR